MPAVIGISPCTIAQPRDPSTIAVSVVPGTIRAFVLAADVIGGPSDCAEGPGPSSGPLEAGDQLLQRGRLRLQFLRTGG
jgi:hypothetical protein